MESESHVKPKKRKRSLELNVEEPEVKKTKRVESSTKPSKPSKKVRHLPFNLNK